MATERITIIVDERGSRVVQGNIRGIGSAARDSAGGVDFLKRALAAIGLTVGLREILQTIDAYTTLQNRLRSTGLEAQNLTGVYQALLQVANETRSSVQGSVELYSRLALSSRELGVSQQQLIGFTKSLNQAIILSGATAQESQAALIQLSQGMASGTLRGDELRSVLEQLPAVADVIAKSMGVTRGQLREMGQDGKITGQTILKAFKDARVELDERFAKTVPTIGQSFQVLKNNLINALGEFDKATGLSALLSQGLLAIATHIGTILKVLVSLGAGWLVVAGGVAVFTALRTAVLLLTAAIAANPFGAFLIALTSAITAMTLFRDQIKLGIDDTTTLGDLMRAAWETIGPIITSIAQTIRMVFGFITEEFRKSFSLWTGITNDGVGKQESAWLSMVRTVAQVFDMIGAVVRGVMIAIGKTIGITVAEAINQFQSLGRVATSALVGDFSGVASALKDSLVGANNFAKEIGTAWGESLNDSISSQVSGGLEATLDKWIARAKEIGKARVEAEKAAEGTVSDVAPPAIALPTKDKDDKKKKRDLAEELKNLISQYDGVYAAQQEYMAGVKLLNESEAAGLITATRKAEVLAMMKEQLKDQLDPLGAVNRELDEQQKLLGMLSDAREVEAQLLSIDKDLRSQGIALGEKELEQLRERLILIQAETKAAEARQQVYDAIRGPQEEFTLQLKAINDLLAQGAITQQEANAFLVQSNQDMFAGTLEGLLAVVTAHEQSYARINELRQADLISEQTANQMKRRADIELAEARLSNQRTFFSTLAGLSNSENKKLAAIGKAAAVTQATIDGVLAVQKALASTPPPASYALAAAVGVVAAANVAQILAQGTKGYAFGGGFEVAGTGGTDSQLVAFRATPGEKVAISTPAQERDRARQDGGGGAAGGGIRIVNVMDPGMIGDWAESPEGDRVLINWLRRNPEVVQSLAGTVAG